MVKLGAKDSRWADIFNNAMFLGMISAFLGYVFSDVMNVTHGDFTGLNPGVCYADFGIGNGYLRCGGHAHQKALDSGLCPAY